MQNSSSRIGFFTIFGQPRNHFFYHFWSKNRVRCIRGLRAPSPYALFYILWRAMSAQTHFFTFFHFFLFFSLYCRNFPSLKILLLAAGFSLTFEMELFPRLLSALPPRIKLLLFAAGFVLTFNIAPFFSKFGPLSDGLKS